MKTRKEFCNEIREMIFANKEIIAAWEGGSAATGFLDEYSDLDLVIVCNDQAVETIFAEFEEYLVGHYGIERKFRVPEPAWHGFSQCFYQISNVPNLFYLDIAVIKKSLPDKFTESDRHGNAEIWFEKEPIIDSTPTPPEEVRKKAERYYKIATQVDFLTILEIKKAIARKNFTEAFTSYYQFIARNLGIMLNLKYRPCKVDFGLRYGYRDYDKNDHDLIESSFKVNSIDELAHKFRIIEKRYHTLKDELKKYNKE